MKRTLSILLALVMVLGLTVPALAAASDTAAPEAEDEYAVDDMMPEDLEEMPSLPAPEEEQPAEQTEMEAELTDLILRVKATLEVDNQYDDLTSDYHDGVTPQWSLTWSDAGRQMTALVRQDGTILSADYWEESQDNDSFYGFDPAFPTLSADQADELAQEWLDKLLQGEESARVDGSYAGTGRDGYYRYTGVVEKNGLPSPVTFALIVNSRGLSSFYRSDSYSGYVGRLPEPEPAVKKAAGAKGLAGAVEMELYYVSDGENEGRARLRYVPVGPYAVVDAHSGETVDMDALYASFGGGAMAAGAYGRAPEPMAEAAMSDSGAYVTEAERQSISQYGDVLDGSALDIELRKLTALGLDAFQLQRCSYAMAPDGETIAASLRYVTEMTAEQLYGCSQDSFQQVEAAGGELTIYKDLTADAKTGRLLSVSTTYPIYERDEAVTMTETNRVRAAENFIGLAAPELAEQAALCTLSGYNEGERVTFAQVHEGYFFPENSLSVTVNPGSGTVDSYSLDWDEDVKFGPADKVIEPEAAKAAYAGALDVTLGYVAWPLDITLEENAVYADLLAQGYTYVEELHLAWYYEGKDAVAGVDAVTGEAIVAEDAGEQTYTYDDLDGVAQAEQIEALARAGIGFAGGRFEPEAELTGRDALTLLLQAAGQSVDKWDDGTLAEQAARHGLMPEDEDFELDGTLTRMAFIRMLLRPSRYGDAAELLSVEADRGYSVIALALGMDVSEPEETATRADAAAMLCAFMSR